MAYGETCVGGKRVLESGGVEERRCNESWLDMTWLRIKDYFWSVLVCKNMNDAFSSLGNGLMIFQRGFCCKKCENGSSCNARVALTYGHHFQGEKGYYPENTLSNRARLSDERISTCVSDRVTEMLSLVIPLSSSPASSIFQPPLPSVSQGTALTLLGCLPS
jgi:hypothetical protein